MYNSIDSSSYTPVCDQERLQCFAPPAKEMCGACGVKNVMFGTSFCSRRCSWLASDRCPQCGRFRAPNAAYCSPQCCQQALQANWCSYCGVCQVSTAGNCTNPRCTGSTVFVCSETRKWKRSRRLSHELVPFGDSNCVALRSCFQPLFSLGVCSEVVAVIRFNGDGRQKKRYLSYRSLVENTMSALGMQKYGHGGEGNEQRRYLPLSLQCSLGFTSRRDGCDPLQGCQNPSCQTCFVLSHGLTMESQHQASHYCTTSPLQSTLWSETNPEGLRAVLVARVVVGNPEVVFVEDNESPPAISVPADPSLFHSVVMTNGDSQQDGTYVFRDDAIDPQYLVVLA